MDGLLVVDKPVGPTSHDVVARLRRLLGERRVGHTGTLDPAASGVLPIVVGRATRLARFLSGEAKTYEAIVALGMATTTCDAEGEPLGPPYAGPLPDRAAIDRTLDRFRGTFLQQPPAFSAKKVGGQRSYALARKQSREGQEGSPELPEPARVTTYDLGILDVGGNLVTLRVKCSAGFYVRALAHDLGAALGVGGHLRGLRRTAVGRLDLSQAIGLEALEREPELAALRLIPLSGMLTDLPAVVLSGSGATHARQGRNLGPADYIPGSLPPAPAEGATPGPVRLLTTDGSLLGLGDVAGTPGSAGLLHPSLVLG